MKRFLTAALSCTLVAIFAPPAYADFSPVFKLSLSDTKVNGNPQLTFHLEFDREDEEIGLFTGRLPRGFKIAADEAIANDEEIGSGQITIHGGPGCHSQSPSDDPRAPITVNATFVEKDRTDDEIDAGVHSVWHLELHVNRVRLLVTGSPSTGWTIEGAPNPSEGTCNPLTADLNINPKSESGVPVVTNPALPRKKKFTATITSQDSPAVANFVQYINITR